MNDIFVLIGGRNAGKSSILRSLCCVELGKPLERSKQKLKLSFENKEIVSFILSSSPQEQTPFCQFEIIKEKLKNFIKSREKRVENGGISDFILIIAFTLEISKSDELGKECIIKPLEFLKSLSDYSVHTIHIKRDDIPSSSRINSFIGENTSPELVLFSEETPPKRQDENARKLKQFMSQFV